MSPRRSWTRTECKYAVPQSHGGPRRSRPGYQPQKPPTRAPGTTTTAPSTMPTERNIDATSVHRRHSTCHRVAHAARGQHPDGEGEGNGEDDEADVEQRRVDRHERVVLEQRVRARDPRSHRGGREGVGRSHHQPEEERTPRRGPEGPSGSPGRQPACGNARQKTVVTTARIKPPQEDRARQRRPHAGDRVEQRGHRAAPPPRRRGRSRGSRPRAPWRPRRAALHQ